MATLTRQALERFLSEHRDRGKHPVRFPFKGSMQTATDISFNKSGGVMVEFEQGGKPVKVALSLTDLTIPPQADSQYRIPSQQPTLKVGSFVKIDIDPKTIDTTPCATERMRRLVGHLGKVTRVDSRGYYRLEPVLESVDPYSRSDMHTFKWADLWVKELTAEEYEYEVVVKPFENLMRRFSEQDVSRVQRMGEQVRELGMQFTTMNRNYMMAMAERNGKKEEVIERKKRQFMQVIESMRKDKRIADISIKPYGILVRTNPLSFKCTEVPIMRKFSQLPAYNIKIDFDRGRGSASFVDSGEPIKGFRYDRGHCHPHMGSGGDPCLGNMAPIFQSGLADFNVADSVGVMLELLESYTSVSNNPYVKISQFYEDAPKCSKCGHHTVLGVCEECGHTRRGINAENYVLPFKWDPKTKVAEKEETPAVLDFNEDDDDE